MDRKVQIPPRSSSSDLERLISDVGFELLQAVTVVHINHLSISGPGSYAAHKAMNKFYDEIGELADDVIEQYQGATGKIIEYPKVYNYPSMKTKQDCLNYLNMLYGKVNQLQAAMHLSEINNVLDEVKSLIDSTKYKLTFLS